MGLFSRNKENESSSKIAKTYEIEVTCANCGAEGLREIPYGKEVDTFIESEICKQCGCKLRADVGYSNWGGEANGKHI